MDGSHYQHQAMVFPAVFPPIYPTAPLPPPPQPLVKPMVPAKREDDDVQFVSSNPVKKRKLDGYRPIMPPSTTAQSMQPTPVSHHPAAAPSHQTPAQIPQVTVTAHPERRGSTGTVDPSSTTHMMDLDPTRGCSVPIPERSNYPESIWTAPSTGRQSSPPVSPKTLPEHVRPSMPRLGETPGSAPGPTNGLTSGAATSNVGVPGSAHPNSNSTNVLQPPSTRAEGTPLYTIPGDQMQTETAKDTCTGETLPGVAGGPDIGNTRLEPPAAAAVNSTSGQQQQATIDAASTVFNYDHSGVSAEPNEILTVPTLDFQRSQSPEKASGSQAQPHAGHPHPHLSTMTSLAQIPLHPSAQTSSHGTSSTQADPCGSRAGTGAKGPCRQCLEARMRQQAATQVANMNVAGVLPSNGSVPTTNPTSAPSTAVQQPWTHMLGINPYHNMMAGAVYGPMLQQSMMTTPNGHFALPQQHPHLTHGLSSAPQTGGHLLSMSPPPSVPTNQSFLPVSVNPKPTKATPTSRNSQASRAQETQLTTKHIIVDIADTCLNMFPFEEVAKRHNQPEQKVRDIFSAVIQVPLLRCNTDKRRAGKLGTARVKEFNLAKKDVQAHVSNTQSKHDAVNQGPYLPSAWEMAQFMGPSDVRLGTLSQYSGPW